MQLQIDPRRVRFRRLFWTHDLQNPGFQNLAIIDPRRFGNRRRQIVLRRRIHPVFFRECHDHPGGRQPLFIAASANFRRPSEPAQIHRLAARFPEQIGYRQIENRETISAVVRRQIQRAGIAELLEQRQRAPVKIIKAIVEGQNHAARRQTVLAQSPHRLIERQHARAKAPQDFQTPPEQARADIKQPFPLLLVAQRNAVVAQDQQSFAPRLGPGGESENARRSKRAQRSLFDPRSHCDARGSSSFRAMEQTAPAYCRTAVRSGPSQSQSSTPAESDRAPPLRTRGAFPDPPPAAPALLRSKPPRRSALPDHARRRAPIAYFPEYHLPPKASPPPSPPITSRESPRARKQARRHRPLPAIREPRSKKPHPQTELHPRGQAAPQDFEAHGDEVRLLPAPATPPGTPAAHARKLPPAMAIAFQAPAAPHRQSEMHPERLPAAAAAPFSNPRPREQTNRRPPDSASSQAGNAENPPPAPLPSFPGSTPAPVRPIAAAPAARTVPFFRKLRRPP